ncbi:hypothetical protein BKA64DRAFT_721800 [Cadophora sp. MPI-SDFR-AT-0126]|nr:hypothetical protein BKA64DRAFT_721800 [Leotiomycetes sp. MPI-SDFR-AT-0126]
MQLNINPTSLILAFCCTLAAATPFPANNNGLALRSQHTSGTAAKAAPASAGTAPPPPSGTPPAPTACAGPSAGKGPNAAVAGPSARANAVGKGAGQEAPGNGTASAGGPGQGPPGNSNAGGNGKGQGPPANAGANGRVKSLQLIAMLVVKTLEGGQGFCIPSGIAFPSYRRPLWQRNFESRFENSLLPKSTTKQFHALSFPLLFPLSSIAHAFSRTLGRT